VTTPEIEKGKEKTSGEQVPVITWTLMALIVLIYLADRRFGLFGPSVVFSDLAMRPPEVLAALRGDANRFPLATIFTSMFLHGGFVHIVANLLFLGVFGPPVEQAFGGWRFMLYYLAWGVFASACQIYATPFRNIPTLGASGAIGGALGAYFLLFPTNRLTVVILGFWEIEARAWILLGLWFLWQIALPQEGVANWAHAGGFLAGMLTVLVIGGRTAILRQHPELIETDD
jgi:membrane associated rhomboid family serine protease